MATKTAATDSQMAMFHALVALAWADGVLTEGEREKVAHLIHHHTRLSERQKRDLLTRIDKQIGIKEAWNRVTSPEDRAHLLNIAGVIFQADGHYSEEEKALYDTLYQQHMATVKDPRLSGDLAAMGAQMRVHSQENDDEFLTEMRTSSDPYVSKFEIFMYRLHKALGWDWP